MFCSVLAPYHNDENTQFVKLMNVNYSMSGAMRCSLSRRSSLSRTNALITTSAGVSFHNTHDVVFCLCVFCSNNATHLALCQCQTVLWNAQHRIIRGFFLGAISLNLFSVRSFLRSHAFNAHRLGSIVTVPKVCFCAANTAA